MKKILTAAVLIAAVCSCTKEGTARFEGYYSYKTSGTISFEATTSGESDSELAPDSMTFSISPASGQLNVLTGDRKSGAVVLTMNAVAGDAVAVDGKAEGSSLTLDDFTKRVSFDLSSSTVERSHSFTFSGSGERLGDMLLLEFTVSGSMDYLGRSYVVSGSDIDCVARLNER